MSFMQQIQSKVNQMIQGKPPSLTDQATDQEDNDNVPEFDQEQVMQVQQEQETVPEAVQGSVLESVLETIPEQEEEIEQVNVQEQELDIQFEQVVQEPEIQTVQVTEQVVQEPEIQTVQVTEQVEINTMEINTMEINTMEEVQEDQEEEDIGSVISGLTTQNATLESKNAVLESRVEDLESEIQRLQTICSKQQKKLQATKPRNTFEQENKQLQQQVQSLQEANSKMVRDNNDLKTKFDAIQAENLRLNNVNAQLRNDLKMWMKDYNSLKNERSMSQSLEVSKNSECIRQLTERVTKHMSEIAVAEKEKAALTSTVKKLQSELGAANEELSKKRIQIMEHIRDQTRTQNDSIRSAFLDKSLTSEADDDDVDDDDVDFDNCTMEVVSVSKDLDYTYSPKKTEHYDKIVVDGKEVRSDLIMFGGIKQREEFDNVIYGSKDEEEEKTLQIYFNEYMVDFQDKRAYQFSYKDGQVIFSCSMDDMMYERSKFPKSRSNKVIKEQVYKTYDDSLKRKEKIFAIMLDAKLFF